MFLDLGRLLISLAVNGFTAFSIGSIHLFQTTGHLENITDLTSFMTNYMTSFVLTTVDWHFVVGDLLFHAHVQVLMYPSSGPKITRKPSGLKMVDFETPGSIVYS